MSAVDQGTVCPSCRPAESRPFDVLVSRGPDIHQPGFTPSLVPTQLGMAARNSFTSPPPKRWCKLPWKFTKHLIPALPHTEQCSLKTAPSSHHDFFLPLTPNAQDALWNAKSPCRRVAQMWRVNPPQSPENAEDASAMSGSTRRSPKTLANSRLASSKAFRGGGGAVDRDCCDGVCWGREGLGRFLQGCMVFIGEQVINNVINRF